MFQSPVHIHLDLVGGIAGDMFVSAIVDLLPSIQEDILQATRIIIPEQVGRAEVSNGLNGGISGKHFRFVEPPKSLDSKHHHHTTYTYLTQLINKSELTSQVKEIAVSLLTIIAKAESKIHASTLEKVHFHELADWDSLMDVVAIAVILNTCENVTWSHSDLPLGGGLVNTQHGLLPVPAPATAEILNGFTFKNDGIEGERITPTGAAILKYLHNNQKINTHTSGVLKATGYGLGTKTFEKLPNILRATLYEPDSEISPKQETIGIVEFDIDDMTGEEIALSVDQLRETTGVIDVIVQQARGKKNRATECFRILCNELDLQNVVQACFIQTSTIGLRYRLEARIILPRVESSHNQTRYKEVTRPNNERTIKVEHDELIKLKSLAARRQLTRKVED